jgi:ribosome maturation factor RimP
MTPMKPLAAKVSTLVTEDLSVMGYELVRVDVLGGASYITLQIMAERIDGKPMTVNDCMQISHAVSARLDSDESLTDRYTLEVSSPGIDRPLIRLKDFERFTGHVARVELITPLESGAKKQKRFEGSIVRITGTEPDAEIEFHTETGDIRVPMNAIAKARLVLTEALLNAGTKH